MYVLCLCIHIETPTIWSYHFNINVSHIRLERASAQMKNVLLVWQRVHIALSRVQCFEYNDDFLHVIIQSRLSVCER
jgi:hypothetical protein